MVIMPRENYFLPRFRGEFTHIVASAISLRQTARGCFDQQDDELKHELEYRTVATRQNIDYLNFSLTNNDIKIVLPGQLSSSWFDPTSPGPILPGREHHWNIRLRNNWMLRRQTSTYHSVIEWTVNADNAVQMHDEIYLKDIDVLDNRKKV